MSLNEMAAAAAVPHTMEMEMAFTIHEKIFVIRQVENQLIRQVDMMIAMTIGLTIVNHLCSVSRLIRFYLIYIIEWDSNKYIQHKQKFFYFRLLLTHCHGTTNIVDNWWLIVSVKPWNRPLRWTTRVLLANQSEETKIKINFRWATRLLLFHFDGRQCTRDIFYVSRSLPGASAI